MSIKLSFEDPVQRDTNRVILSRTPDKNPNPALGYRLTRSRNSIGVVMNFQAARPTMISAMLAIPVHNFMGGFRGGMRGPQPPVFLLNFVIFLMTS